MSQASISVYTDLLLNKDQLVAGLAESQADVQSWGERIGQTETSVNVGANLQSAQSAVDAFRQVQESQSIIVPLILDTSAAQAQMEALRELMENAPAMMGAGGIYSPESMARQVAIMQSPAAEYASAMPSVYAPNAPGIGPMMSSPSINGDRVIYGGSGVGEFYRPESVSSVGDNFVQPPASESAQPAFEIYSPASQSEEPISPFENLPENIASPVVSTQTPTGMTTLRPDQIATQRPIEEMLAETAAFGDARSSPQSTPAETPQAQPTAPALPASAVNELAQAETAAASAATRSATQLATAEETLASSATTAPRIEPPPTSTPTESTERPIELLPENNSDPEPIRQTFREVAQQQSSTIASDVAAEIGMSPAAQAAIANQVSPIAPIGAGAGGIGLMPFAGSGYAQGAPQVEPELPPEEAAADISHLSRVERYKRWREPIRLESVDYSQVGPDEEQTDALQDAARQEEQAVPMFGPSARPQDSSRIGPRLPQGQFGSMEGQELPVGAREGDAFSNEPEAAPEGNATSAIPGLSRMLSHMVGVFAFFRAINSAEKAIESHVAENDFMNEGGISPEQMVSAGRKFQRENNGGMSSAFARGIGWAATLGGLTGERQETRGEAERRDLDDAETANEMAKKKYEQTQQAATENRRIDETIKSAEIAAEPEGHQKRLDEISEKNAAKQREADELRQRSGLAYAVGGSEAVVEQIERANKLSQASEREADTETRRENVREDRSEENRRATTTVEKDELSGDQARAERDKVIQQVRSEARRISDEATQAHGETAGINAGAHWMRDIGQPMIDREDSRIKTTESIEDSRGQRRVSDVQGDTADSAMRAEGRTAEADRDKFVRDQNDRASAARDAATLANPANGGKDAAQFTRLDATATAEAKAATDNIAAYDAGKQREKADTAKQINAEIAADEMRARGATYDADTKMFQSKWEEKLEIARRNNDPNLQLLQNQYKAETAERGHAQTEKYDDLRISGQQDLLRDTGHSDEAEVLGLRERIAKLQREAGDNPERQKQVSDYANAEIEGMRAKEQKEMAGESQFGLSGQQFQREFQREIIEGAQKQSGLAALAKLQEDVQGGKPVSPDAPDLGSLAGQPQAVQDAARNLMHHEPAAIATDESPSGEIAGHRTNEQKTVAPAPAVVHEPPKVDGLPIPLPVTIVGSIPLNVEGAGKGQQMPELTTAQAMQIEPAEAATAPVLPAVQATPSTQPSQAETAAPTPTIAQAVAQTAQPVTVAPAETPTEKPPIVQTPAELSVAATPPVAAQTPSTPTTPHEDDMARMVRLQRSQNDLIKQEQTVEQASGTDNPQMVKLEDARAKSADELFAAESTYAKTQNVNQSEVSTRVSAEAAKPVEQVAAKPAATQPAEPQAAVPAATTPIAAVAPDAAAAKPPAVATQPTSQPILADAAREPAAPISSPAKAGNLEPSTADVLNYAKQHGLPAGSEADIESVRAEMPVTDSKRETVVQQDRNADRPAWLDKKSDAPSVETRDSARPTTQPVMADAGAEPDQESVDQNNPSVHTSADKGGPRPTTQPSVAAQNDKPAAAHKPPVPVTGHYVGGGGQAVQDVDKSDWRLNKIRAEKAAFDATTPGSKEHDTEQHRLHTMVDSYKHERTRAEQKTAGIGAYAVADVNHKAEPPKKSDAERQHGTAIYVNPLDSSITPQMQTQWKTDSSITSAMHSEYATRRPDPNEQAGKYTWGNVQAATQPSIPQGERATRSPAPMKPEDTATGQNAGARALQAAKDNESGPHAQGSKPAAHSDSGYSDFRDGSRDLKAAAAQLAKLRTVYVVGEQA